MCPTALDAQQTTRSVNSASNVQSSLAPAVRKREWQERNNVVRTAAEEAKKLQSETVLKMRSLSHDLSNYIETIMQASYLLAQAKLDENNKKWLELIDKASRDAARINREIRDILRSQS
jgi:K+-sensing histidine kinase KdpD